MPTTTVEGGSPKGKLAVGELLNHLRVAAYVGLAAALTYLITLVPVVEVWLGETAWAFILPLVGAGLVAARDYFTDTRRMTTTTTGVDVARVHEDRLFLWPVVFCIVLAAGGPAWATDPVPLVLKVSSPETAAVGELIVLDTEGSVADRYAWTTVPELKKGFAVDSSGKRAYMAAPAGTYTVLIVAADLDELQIMSRTITVGGPRPPPPGPGPPGPGPAPTTLRGKVESWARAVPGATAATVGLVANNFSSVAAKAAATDMDVEAMLRETFEANQATLGADLPAWRDYFFSRLNAEVQGMAERGLLPDKDSHVELWHEVAGGLTDAAN